MADDVRLLVNGTNYGGWTGVRLTRGIEAIAGSFELTVSERWDGQREPWPILEEDQCAVLIGATPVITGFVDQRSQAFGAERHTFSVSGRDVTGALVDCSAVLKKYEFRHIGVLELCDLLTAPFGIPVYLQPGITDVAISTTGKAHGGAAPAAVGSAGRSSSMRLSAPKASLPINPGDSPFEVIDRACRLVGLLPVSDGAGGLVLTRTGGTRATTILAEGENVLGADVTFDASRRYRRYVVSGQGKGSDDVIGLAAAAVTAEAVDARVRRSARVLLIRPEGAVTLDFARQRAAWEMTVRAARSARLRVVVQGWTQRDGSLWPINAIVPVHLPTLGVTYTDMLITEVTQSLSLEGGTTTQIELAQAQSFLPEPTIAPASGQNSAPAWLG